MFDVNSAAASSLQYLITSSQIYAGQRQDSLRLHLRPRRRRLLPLHPSQQTRAASQPPPLASAHRLLRHHRQHAGGRNILAPLRDCLRHDLPLLHDLQGAGGQERAEDEGVADVLDCVWVLYGVRPHGALRLFLPVPPFLQRLPRALLLVPFLPAHQRRSRHLQQLPQAQAPAGRTVPRKIMNPHLFASNFNLSQLIPPSSRTPSFLPRHTRRRRRGEVAAKVGAQFQINNSILRYNLWEVAEGMDDEFFTESEQPQQQQFQQELGYNPPTFQEPIQLGSGDAYNGNQFQFAYDTSAPAAQPADNDNDFNDFEEDETTRRIREQEERIQNLLKDKSEREWEEKQKRREEGRRQLEEYQARKEEEKVQRAQDNLRKQAENKEELAKLNVAAGWKKVITNINVRQGERKGVKDTNRMREAILHRREDDDRR